VQFESGKFDNIKEFNKISDSAVQEEEGCEFEFERA